MARQTYSGLARQETPDSNSSGNKLILRASKGVETIMKPTKISGKQIKFIQRRPTIVLSQAQMMLNEMFTGEPTFGTGQNLPVLNRALTSGSGILRSGDETKATARMFGFGRQ